MLWRCLSWLDLTKSSKIQGSSKSVSKVESRLYIDSEDIRTSGGFNKLVDIVHGDYVISSLKYGMVKVQHKKNVNLEFITNPKCLKGGSSLNTSLSQKSIKQAGLSRATLKISSRFSYKFPLLQLSPSRLNG